MGQAFENQLFRGKTARLSQVPRMSPPLINYVNIDKNSEFRFSLLWNETIPTYPTGYYGNQRIKCTEIV